MGLRLTGKLQLKAFAGVLTVGDELEPHAAGSAVDAGAEHFRAAEGAQQASRAVAAIIDLGGTRNEFWKTPFIATLGVKPFGRANRGGSFEAKEMQEDVSGVVVIL